MPERDATVEVPALVLDALGASANDVLLVLDEEMTVAWVSPSSTAVVGWDPDELVGRGAFELLHPDELERALHVAAAASEGYAPRSTARYRIRSPEGTWIECDLSVGQLGTPEQPRGLSVWIRRAYDQLILREVVAGLLSDEPTSAVLSRLLDLVFARNDVSRCAITFLDDDGTETWVGSDLPEVLVGRGGAAEAELWDAARHGLVETLVEAADDLPVALAGPARSAGLDGLWVLPITDQQVAAPHGAGGDVAADGEPSWTATVTVWTVAGGPSPHINTYAVSLLRQLVALIVRWRRQVTDLAEAALHDPLTGLANRRVLDGVVAAASERATLTLLSLDLDGFKPVNDTLGHAAGDEVLRHTARRLERTVRAGDVVMRLGGDEFLVACADLDDHEALALAARLREAVQAPVAVAGTEVRIGTSVGIATGTGAPQELLAAADRALYRAKERPDGVAVAEPAG